MNEYLQDLKLLRRLNWGMFFTIAVLLVVGVLFVYSSCYVSEERLNRTFYLKQMIWAFAGVLCYLAFTVFDYRRFGKLSVWIYGFCICLLLIVLIPHVGVTRYGAQRWLKFFGVMVQPSELAKLAMIIALATTWIMPAIDYGSLKPLLGILALIGVPIGLIILEPDLGTAMVFVPTAFIMMFVGGVPSRVLVSIVLIGVLAVGLLLSILLLPEKLDMTPEKQDRVMRMVGLRPHQKKRILVFLGLDDDPLGAGWNKMQSIIAVGSGGKWGKGYKNGTQNMLGFLPRSVAPTDFIYSVIAEEKGFCGSVVVLALFGSVILCGMQSALVAKDAIGRLLCVGIVTMVFCHVFINIAMTVGLMPITGLPLPLLSYGGSSMVVMMSALGITQSVFVRARRLKTFETEDD